ncbi:MAG: 50S ribosomal protein L23 [Candidatus Aenigmarchaeota archaeon]|nr:50S ribosomal protein L23 [Candidatus Aenigmarchaeota archaeon]
MDHFNVIKFVLMTEKSIQNIEKENKLVFIVNRKATKKQISDAVRSAFNTATASVRTSIDQKGRKKAFVRFAKAGEAGDIAVRLGII